MRQAPASLWSVEPCWPGETVVLLGGGDSLTDQQVEHVRVRQAEGRCRVIAINRAYERAPWADWLFGCDPGWFWAWCSGPNRINVSSPLDALDFQGRKVSVWSHDPSYPAKHGEMVPKMAGRGVLFLQHRGDGWHTGLSDDPGFVRGNNGCYQVLSVLPFTGAARALLLGIDMTTGKHWHAEWPIGSPKYEDATPERPHEARMWLRGRQVSLGWYQDAERARQVVAEYTHHIAAGCPNPAPRLTGIIPRFATLPIPLAAAGVEVVNCSPGSMLTVFPQGRLEDVLP